MKAKAKDAVRVSAVRVRVGRYTFLADEVGAALTELLRAKRAQRLGEAMIRELLRQSKKAA